MNFDLGGSIFSYVSCRVQPSGIYLTAVIRYTTSDENSVEYR